jgi:nitrogenase-stabilizing/protective protein
MEWFTTLPGIDELDTAEAFFNYFELPFDHAFIVAKRMHIMHEFHRRLAGAISIVPADASDGSAGELIQLKARWSLARRLLEESYTHLLQGDSTERSARAVYQPPQRFFTAWDELTAVRP